MRIRKLTIQNFGRIRNRTFELSPGINVLYGENESGKSTFHTFIKAMLYGLTRQRGKAARNDLYTTYEPWDNPGKYGGILWFSRGGADYRLTRNFSRERPYHELLCETNGALTDAENGSLSQVLSGVSEVVYDNTVSVAQLKSVTGKDLVRELQNYMAGYQGGGDSSIDLDRAVQMLKMSRKGFLVQGERQRKEILQQQNQVHAKMEYLEQEIDGLLDRQESGDAGKAEEKKKALLIAHLRDLRRRMGRNRVIFILLPVISAAAGAALFPVSHVLTVGLCLAAVLLAFWGALNGRSLKRDYRKREKLLERIDARQKKRVWNQENLERMLEEKGSDYENLRAEYQEYEEILQLPSEEDIEAEAITLALDTIQELSGNINSHVGEKLRLRTSRILSEITGGKYREVLMDENFRMTVNTTERTIPLERLSRGTLEQIYVALRMAAGELFCGEEPFPVILDDVFGMYDEERLLSVLRWLYGEDRQIIISTCQRREIEILKREEIPFQLLTL